MSQKVFRTGNSLALTIPALFARALGLHPGAMVKTKIDIARLRITYEFSGTRQLPLLKSFSSGTEKK